MFQLDSKHYLYASELTLCAWLYSHNGGLTLYTVFPPISIGMFATASFLLNGSERHYPGQIANYTNSLFQPEELICDAVSWRKKRSIQPLYWSDCWGQFRKVSIKQQNQSIFKFMDWGPYGLFVNCSEEQEKNHSCSWYHRVNTWGFHKTNIGFLDW